MTVPKPDDPVRCRTVYAYTTGEYSDYTVHCLFETEALAKGYADALRANEDAAALANGEEPYGSYRYANEIEPFQLWSVVPVMSLEEREFPRRDGPFKRWVAVEEEPADV